MKRFALGCAVILLVGINFSCQRSTQVNDTGQLMGALDRPDWDHINPHGMALYPFWNIPYWTQ